MGTVGACCDGGWREAPNKLESYVSLATSVPTSQAGQLGLSPQLRVAALMAHFTVDLRVLQWPPGTVAEHLAVGHAPEGLPIDGRPSIHGLALGFSLEVMEYDHDSQIYHGAVWTRTRGWCRICGGNSNMQRRAVL